MRKLTGSIFLSFFILLINSCNNATNDNTNSANNNQNTYSTELVKFSTKHFAGSGNCAECHSSLRDEAGNDVSIDKDWRSTMMANASKDPFWQAKVHTEIIRNPDYKEIIEEKCATCHMPMAKKQAEFDGKDIKIFDDGFLDPDNKYHKLAMDGVSCTLCHQIQDDGRLGTKESFSGNFTIGKDTEKPDREIYGPFTNPLTMPMRMRVGFTPTYSPHVNESKLCATCHTLYTPTIGEDGNIIGEIPEQTPYLEWKYSKFGDGGDDDISCQGCHMPQAVGKVKISNRPGMLQGREPFYKHYFVGGNVFMLKILRRNIEELKLTAEKEHFDRTIQRTIDMLKSSAELQIGNITKNGNILEVPITVINKSGHKLPTGYPSRRVWIHFVVKDKNNNIIFESGKSSDDGKIYGNNSDYTNSYEPHYQVIDSEDKVQIYESIMADTSGNVTYTLLKGAYYIKDNRLLPEGFNKQNAPEDIEVKGNAKTDSDFIDGQDTVLYKVDTTGFEGPFIIEAKLKYQSIAYGFYKDLLNDEVNSKYVKIFKLFYEEENNEGYTITEVSKTY